MIATPPSAEADFLISHYGNPQPALDHAEWAWKHVKKPETKEFWREVIAEIRKYQTMKQKAAC